MSDESDLKMMSAYALASVALAAVTLVGIAVVPQFKTGSTLFTEPAGCGGANSTLPWCVMEANANAFIAGLAIFGSFMSVISIALVGKIVIGLFKGGY